jgi:hypothetical protein
LARELDVDMRCKKDEIVALKADVGQLRAENDALRASSSRARTPSRPSAAVASVDKAIQIACVV